jgi:hypothetical protein
VDLGGLGASGRLPPLVLAFDRGLGDPFALALERNLALELGDRADDVEHEPAGAWVAGPEYRDIASLFEQARRRLKPFGTMYVLLSSDSDLHFFGQLIAKAGFRARTATALSILVESMIIYELTPVETGAAASSSEALEAENFENREADFVGRQDARVDLNRVQA